METPEPTPVALLHGQQFFRHTLSRLLEELPGYQLMLRLADMPELKRAVATGACPQLLVVGLAAAEEAGAALLQWCNAHLPACRVLVLGCPQEPDSLAALLLAGAHGFCCEDEVLVGLRSRLDMLCAGALYFPPTLLAGLRSRVPPPRPVAKLDKPLNAEHRQFLCLLARGDGLSYHAIAELMGISVFLVKKYRRVLGKRFGVKTRQGLVEVARELGLG
jgi:DNA-binding NarL/FixJ family response regulator